MRDRDRVLDRLAKLLALAQSPNHHEATAATRLAESLMARHKLTREDVAAHAPAGLYERAMGAKGFELVWKFSLITATARFCGCEAIALQMGKRKKVRLVGERELVDQAAELFLSLLTTLAEIEKAEAAWISDPNVLIYSRPQDYAVSFRQGVTVAVIEKMQQLRPERFGMRGKKSPQRSPEEARVEAPSGPPTSPSTSSSVTPGPRQAMVLHVPPQKDEKDYSEKVKVKYSPRRVKLHLEDAADDGAYWRGYRAGKSMVVLPGDSAPGQPLWPERSSDGGVTE